MKMEIFRKIQDCLSVGKPLSEEITDSNERNILKPYQLLCLKPCLYLLNAKDGEIDKEVVAVFEKNQWPYLVMDVLTEFDGVDMSLEERKAFGIPEELKINSLIEKTYRLLDLITFFSTRSNEIRAWTIKKGSTVSQAGGLIHSDFETHFIKAEVIQYDELLKGQGFLKAREKGLIRTEGKEYEVKDGDVVEFKI